MRPSNFYQFDDYVYIMASLSKTLYTGVTSDLSGRVWEHKQGLSGFTSRYNINRLVYFEHFDNIWDAIAREKQIKRWRRDKKIFIIEKMNPEWRDLYNDLE